MSEELAEGPGIHISTYSGPQRADGGQRKRYQIVVVDAPEVDGARIVTLSAEQWALLGGLFTDDQARQAASAAQATQRPGRQRGGART